MTATFLGISGCGSYLGGSKADTTSAVETTRGRNSNSSADLKSSSRPINDSKTKVNTALAGEVKVDGSSTVYPITVAAASAFNERFPRVAVNVGKSGTGGGFKKFVQGDTDISDASRPIKIDELAECAKRSITFLEIPIAYDGIAVCVHKDNTFINTISVEDLKRIFSAELAIKSWNELDPSYPDRPIKIFMPDTESGTYEYFRDVVVGKDGKIREDVTPSSEDVVLVNGIANEKYSIGFFGASYFFNAQNKLKALKVVDPATNSAVSLSVEAIENATYAPFARPLFIYVNTTSLKRPEVRRFVQYYLDHVIDLSRSVQSVPLTGELQKLVRSRLDEAKPGTYFSDASGNPRTGKLAGIYQESNLTPLQ